MIPQKVLYFPRQKYTCNTHLWIRRKLKYSHHYQAKINSWMIPHKIFLTSLIKIWIHTSWSEQSLGPGPQAALAGPRDRSLHSVWIHIFIRDVKKIVFGIIHSFIFAIYFIPFGHEIYPIFHCILSFDASHLMTKYSGISLVMMWIFSFPPYSTVSIT